MFYRVVFTVIFTSHKITITEIYVYDMIARLFLHRIECGDIDGFLVSSVSDENIIEDTTHTTAVR